MSFRYLSRAVLVIAMLVQLAAAQSGVGSLRVGVVSQDGKPLAGAVSVVGLGNAVSRMARASDGGDVSFAMLPFGRYTVHVTAAGFAPARQELEISSGIPQDVRVVLGLAPVTTTVAVSQSPYPVISTVRRNPGREQVEMTSPQPARGTIDLVRTEPGWLLEANGVLHPRGSEYDTQFVVDGFPLTDNRSPAFVPAFAPAEFESISVLTGGYPAEYGRKLGGIVEGFTGSASHPGFNGQAALSAGSFATGTAEASVGYSARRWSTRMSATSSETDRYLDPPTTGSLNNSGKVRGLTLLVEGDASTRDRVRAYLRGTAAEFGVPNEEFQHERGQRQQRKGGEYMGQLSYQRVLSRASVFTARTMVRDVAAMLDSNARSTPVIANLDRGFLESYIGVDLSVRRGRHNAKVGGDAVYSGVREQFACRISDSAYFDPAVPATFAVALRESSREFAAYVQDQIRLGNAVISAGIRFDSYSFLVEENAVSPRLGVAWMWPRAGVVVRASYDRVFQTPAIENLLLASSAGAKTLTPDSQGVPVPPSSGNFFEAGFTKELWGKAKLDASFFRRTFTNFADDDVFLNTGISFPISFARARIYGFESKLELPRVGPVTASLSYSNLVGEGSLPVTGGLFLEEDADELFESDHPFRISQDQRSTMAGFARYSLGHRAWAAVRGSFGSGLPVELEGEIPAGQDARIGSAVDWESGRLRPNWQIDLLGGGDVWVRGRRSASLQVHVENVTNRLNVINFAGLLSGTAIGQPRSIRVRLLGRF